MLKKLFTLALCVSLLGLPAIASAANWGDVMLALYRTGSYTSDDITATKEGDTVTVTGGYLEFDYNGKDAIYEPGTFIFNGVTFDGNYGMVVRPYDGAQIDITLDEECKFISTVEESKYSGGVFISFVNDGSTVNLVNNTTIGDMGVGLRVGYYRRHKDNKLTVTGSGSLYSSTSVNELGTVLYPDDPTAPLSDELLAICFANYDNAYIDQVATDKDGEHEIKYAIEVLDSNSERVSHTHYRKDENGNWVETE